MEIISTTPFGRRPVTAGLVERAIATRGGGALPPDVRVEKWALMRQLCTARTAFGITDRDLAVLHALVSFHQGDGFSGNDNLIVYPSNATLAERSHGMAESTLRRHIAALVKAGLLRRHDSPNGKRYAARDIEGNVVRAFGFDLSPLLERSREISSAAAEVTAAQARLKRIREELVLARRDAARLAEYGMEHHPDPSWDDVFADLADVSRALRRRMDEDDLLALRERVLTLRDRVGDKLRKTLNKTDELHGNDVQNEHHYSESNTDSYDLEPPVKQEGAAGVAPDGSEGEDAEPDAPSVPLGLVLKACPDILDYADRPIRQWHDLVVTASFVRGMMGISPDAWQKAQETMGPAVAAVTVAGILQRVDDIRSPGGYLRSLTNKAEIGGYSPGPLIMGLLHAKAA